MIDLTRFSLVPLLLSSVSGTIVTYLFYKEGVMFEIPEVDDLNRSILPYYIFFSVFVALISLYFTKVSLFIEGWFIKIKSIPKRFFYGAGFLGVLLFLFPGLYGEGYRGINNLLKDNNDALFYGSPFESLMADNILIYLGFFLVLALLKVLATGITLGAGGIGGIFAPAVFSGGIIGFVFAASINNVVGYELVSTHNFILVGMAGCLTGVLHAPLTGIFLISEITQSYELIVPLLIVSTITYIIVKAIEPNSIFTKQLALRGELLTHNKDKAVVSFMKLRKLIENNFNAVHSEASLRELIQIISKSRRNIFPVLDKDGKLQGIIHVEDIRHIIFKQEHWDRLFVSNLMLVPSLTVDINEPMQDVIDKFHKSKEWNLPVLENGKYLGFISKSNLFSEYRKNLKDITED
jgi:chloride channel protein, CIC family